MINASLLLELREIWKEEFSKELTDAETNSLCAALLRFGEIAWDLRDMKYEKSSYVSN